MKVICRYKPMFKTKNTKAIAALQITTNNLQTNMNTCETALVNITQKLHEMQRQVDAISGLEDEIEDLATTACDFTTKTYNIQSQLDTQTTRIDNLANLFRNSTAVTDTVLRHLLDRLGLSLMVTNLGDPSTISIKPKPKVHRAPIAKKKPTVKKSVTKPVVKKAPKNLRSCINCGRSPMAHHSNDQCMLGDLSGPKFYSPAPVKKARLVIITPNVTKKTPMKKAPSKKKSTTKKKATK